MRLNADGDCSLREAISSSANADTKTDACAAGDGADEIILPSGTYRLSIEGAAEDAAATGDLDITSELTISGAGAATTVIDANMIDRVFHVDPSGSGIAATIRGVTIRGGADSHHFVRRQRRRGHPVGVPNTLGGTAPSWLIDACRLRRQRQYQRALGRRHRQKRRHSCSRE